MPHLCYTCDKLIKAPLSVVEQKVIKAYNDVLKVGTPTYRPVCGHNNRTVFSSVTECQHYNDCAWLQDELKNLECLLQLENIELNGAVGVEASDDVDKITGIDIGLSMKFSRPVEW